VNTCLEDTATGENFPLLAVTQIGRAPDCEVLIKDPRVSRHHAMIRKVEGSYYFYELGSFNGTYVNDRRVTTGHKLENGDQLTVVDSHFVVRLSEEDASTSDDMLGATMGAIQRLDAIIFVSDVQGFTTLSERLPPEELAQAIGSWYRYVDELLVAYGATADKFVGDAVLAYWRTSTLDNRVNALKAAGAMQSTCDRIYQDHREAFDSTGLQFRSGVAVHVGSVACGGMSSTEHTLLGDAVNATFRVEGLTRQLGNVLVTDSFVEQWPEPDLFFDSVGSHQVKGRAQEVGVFSVKAYPE